MPRRKQDAPSKLKGDKNSDKIDTSEQTTDHSGMSETDEEDEIVQSVKDQSTRSESPPMPREKVETSTICGNLTFAMEQFLQRYGKKAEEPTRQRSKSTRTDAVLEATMQATKPTPGRQLSKAERYRWIIQEPANQASKMSSALPKRISPQTTPHMPSSNGIGATELRPDNQAIRNQPNPLTDTPSCYNSRLFRSIVKGASDFKCKHCGESFTKLECLTKHMYSKGHFTEKEQDTERQKMPEIVSKKQKDTPEPDTSAARVLSCLRCGASFESLQDLSCHMVKTKHHESIPSIKTYHNTPHLNSLKSSKTLLSSSMHSSAHSLHHQSLFHRLPESSLHQASVPPQLSTAHLQKPLLSALPFHTKPILDSLPIYNLFPLIGLRPQIANPNWNAMFQQQTLAYIQALQHQQKEQAQIAAAVENNSEDSVSVSSTDQKSEVTITEVKKAPKRHAPSSIEPQKWPIKSPTIKEEQSEPLDLSRKRHCESPRSGSSIRVVTKSTELIRHESDVDICEATSPSATPTQINHANSNDNNSTVTVNGSTSNLIDNHLQRIKALTKNVIRNFDDDKFPAHPTRKVIILDNHNDNQHGAKDNHEKLVQKSNPIIAIENLVKNQVAKIDDYRIAGRIDC